MLGSDRIWHKVAGASEEAINELKSASPISLPDEYVALLQFSNGGEGPLAVQPGYCCLDSAEITVENIKNRAFEEHFGSFLIFGGNGGGELLAMDIRGDTAPWPIVAIDMCNSNLKESVMSVAKSFAQFVSSLGQ